MKNDELIQTDYNKHLESINGIKFTPREIDIISCLLSGRTPKVIASFLEISPRTIETHIRNVMLKVECHSREGIINFIEKTGKGVLIKKHYLNLLSEYTFNQKLREVLKLAKPLGLSVLLLDEEDSNYSSFLAHLEKSFNLAGIDFHIELSPKDQDALSLYKESVYKESVSHYLYMPSASHFMAPTEPQKRNLLFFTEMAEKRPGSVFFLFNPPQNLPNPIRNIEFINFGGSYNNYYFGFFEILRKMISDSKLDTIITQFKKEYAAIHSPYSNLLEYIGIGDSNEVEPNQKLAWVQKHPRALVAGGVFVLSVLATVTSMLMWETTSIETHGSVAIRSDLFVPSESTLLDRAHYLAQIEEKLNTKNGIRTIALIGIGGAGKTTLARRYARNQQVSVVWEINAVSKESLIHSFENLAHALCKEEAEKRELKAILEIKVLLEREEKLLVFVKEKLRKHYNWVLVYNDLNDFSKLQNYVPSDENTWGIGRVIITTSDSNIENHECVDSSLHIGELSAQDKLKLFTQIMNTDGDASAFTQSPEQTQAFLNNIPPFPLDITIAAYYLKATQISYEKYLEYLKGYDEDFALVQERILKGAHNYTGTRYNIIALSLKKLMETDKDFSDLLLLISLLESQDIPRALLESYKGQVVVDNFIYNLKKYSLLTRGAGKTNYSFPTLSVHKSTQEISLAYLTKTFQLENNTDRLQSVTYTLEKYASVVISEQDFSKMKILARNLKSFLKHQILKEDILKGIIKAKLGVVYFNLGDYLKSKKNLEESLELLDKKNTDNNARIPNILTHLGIVYRKLGDYQKARELLEAGLDGCRTYYPENFQEITQSLRYLGMVHKSLGNYEKAKELFQESLNIHLAHFSKKQTGYAWSLGSLGVVYRKLGQYEKARDLLTESLEVYKNYFPESHSGLAWTLTHLGRVYIYLGDFQKAKELFEQSLQIYRTHLSENNVRVSWVLGPLGIVFRELEDYVKAEQLLKQSLEIYSKNLPEDHISISWATSHLAIVYKYTGNYEKAKELLNKSMKGYAKYYGSEHIENARLLLALGHVYFMEGNLDEAEDLITKALTLFQKSKHPRTYVALECLADIYIKRLSNSRENKERANDYAKKAKELLGQSLEIVEASFPQNSPHAKRIESKIKMLT